MEPFLSQLGKALPLLDTRPCTEALFYRILLGYMDKYIPSLVITSSD